MSYFYLGTVYRRYAWGLDAAAEYAARCAARFVDAGIPVFAPIVHSHHIALYTQLDAKDARWLALQEPFMSPALGMIRVLMDGYTESEGLNHELIWFRSAGKLTVDVHPTSLISDFHAQVPHSVLEQLLAGDPHTVQR